MFHSRSCSSFLFPFFPQTNTVGFNHVLRNTDADHIYHIWMTAESYNNGRSRPTPIVSVSSYGKSLSVVCVCAHQFPCICVCVESQSPHPPTLSSCPPPSPPTCLPSGISGLIPLCYLLTYFWTQTCCTVCLVLFLLMCYGHILLTPPLPPIISLIFVVLLTEKLFCMALVEHLGDDSMCSMLLCGAGMYCDTFM